MIWLQDADFTLHQGDALEVLRELPSESVDFTDCGHDAYRPGIVFDPFCGSGTVALVARKHGRRCVGIELNPAYCEMIERRTQQLSLLADEGATIAP